MQCVALTHANSNVVGVRGLLRGSFFASQARNCKQTVIQASFLLTKKQNFKFLKSYFANFKTLLTRLSRLLNLGCTTFSTKFRVVICSLINFKICQGFFIIKHMRHDSAIACHLERARGFTSTSSRNCKQTRDLKRGIRGRLRNSSPPVSLLKKQNFKILKTLICKF